VTGVIRDQQREHECLNYQRRDRIRARRFPAKSERCSRFLHRRTYLAEPLSDQAEFRSLQSSGL
jgi:hypothetical protein